MDAKQLHFLDATSKWSLFLGLFGLFNLKEVGRFEKKISYIHCPAKTLISIIFIILYSIFFYIQLTYGDGIFYHHIDIKSLNFFISYSSIPVAILIILTTLSHTNGLGEELTDVITCEFTFSKDYSSVIQKKTTKFLLTFISAILISLTCDLLRLYYENWSPIIILNLIASYIFAIYSIASVLHFSIIQFWIYSSFLRINLNLTNALQNFNGYSKAAKRENTIHEEILSELVPVEVANKIYWANDVFKNKPKNVRSIVEQIKDLRMKYNNVFKISRKCDEVFSSRNLVVVAANFIMSVIVLFFSLQFARQYLKNPDAVTGMDIISSLKGSILCLSNIWGLVVPCGVTCKEARKTALIIQDKIIDVDDQDLKIALKEFASQLLHQNVYFSPHGFFLFENGMLLSIFSAVASYLIILLQFHPVYKTHKDEKDGGHWHLQ